MFCLHCGQEISEGSKFCSSCGKGLEQPVQEQQIAFYDKNNNLIDLPHIYGIYKNKLAISGYFSRCTDYSDAEIAEAVRYITEHIEPETMNLFIAAAEQAKLEATVKPKKTTKRERIKENKADGIACCPKCGSTSLSSSKQGAGIGKAAIGVWALGPIGAAAGALGANKTHVTCLNCGHKWKL